MLQDRLYRIAAPLMSQQPGLVPASCYCLALPPEPVFGIRLKWQAMRRQCFAW